MPHAKRCASSYWLETSPNGSRVLLDAGGDTPHRLAEEQLDWPNLDAIWISHEHWDHMAGLPALLFGMKWAPQTENRTKKLSVFGAPGIGRMLEEINSANSFKLYDQKFPVEILEVEPGKEFQFAHDLSARTLPTPHTNASAAIRLTSKTNKTLVYTSDTGWFEELIPFCSNANVVLVECSYRKNKPVQKHLELSDVMKLAKAATPEILVLTHLYPEWDDVDLVAEARALWTGTTVEATDGLKLNI